MLCFKVALISFSTLLAVWGDVKLNMESCFIFFGNYIHCSEFHTKLTVNILQLSTIFKVLSFSTMIQLKYKC